MLTINGESHGTVFTVDSGSTTEINDLTITGGHSNYSGGISNSGTLTITDSIISGNSSLDQGGGIVNWYGTLTVSDSTITGNSAIEGGAIYNLGTASVMDTTISGNSATSAGGVYSKLLRDHYWPMILRSVEIPLLLVVVPSISTVH